MCFCSSERKIENDILQLTELVFIKVMSAIEYSNARCTHEPIPFPGSDDYDPVFDFPCEFNYECQLCNASGCALRYCQYQIQGQCSLCGYYICEKHLGAVGHLTLCIKCNIASDSE